MARYIPAGRDDLWRRQKIADAEVKRLERGCRDAERRVRDLARALHPDDRVVQEAGWDADQLYAAFCRAETVAERIYEERTAGLSGWIDTCPHLPVCSTCDGSGRRADAEPGDISVNAGCPTCRGWGREDDGRPGPPIWSEKEQAWIDPTTGRTVDIPDPTAPGPATPEPVAEQPDLADLRRGTWYDRTPFGVTATTPAGGAGMSSIDEVRAGIMAANEAANEGLGALQQAHTSLEQAQGALMRATEGSGQADVSEANGLLAQAIGGIENIRSQVAAAIADAESVANRL